MFFCSVWIYIDTELPLNLNLVAAQLARAFRSFAEPQRHNSFASGQDRDGVNAESMLEDNLPTGIDSSGLTTGRTNFRQGRRSLCNHMQFGHCLKTIC